MVSFLHFSASLLLQAFFGLFVNDSGLLRWAQVDRGMFKLQSFHLYLVYNGAGWPVASSKVNLFHVFPALIGCFMARFCRHGASLVTDVS